MKYKSYFNFELDGETVTKGSTIDSEGFRDDYLYYLYKAGYIDKIDEDKEKEVLDGWY